MTRRSTGGQKRRGSATTSLSAPACLAVYGIMNIRLRSFAMAYGLAPVVIAPQLIVIELCEYFQVVWPMLVLGPLAVLVFGLVWVHYVTGMKCKACDGNYGVSFSFISVLSILEKCIKCGTPADTA